MRFPWPPRGRARGVFHPAEPSHHVPIPPAGEGPPRCGRLEEEHRGEVRHGGQEEDVRGRRVLSTAVSTPAVPTLLHPLLTWPWPWPPSPTPGPNTSSPRIEPTGRVLFPWFCAELQSGSSGVNKALVGEGDVACRARDGEAPCCGTTLGMLISSRRLPWPGVLGGQQHGMLPCCPPRGPSHGGGVGRDISSLLRSVL